MSAYYNEFDPKAAAWLRELIKRGHIADGVVDERSILDVSAEDLVGHTQCHFFAGIGGWSYALRLAGWPDDRPVWTGSPPCQPFSAAGAGKGQDDERHLGPHFAALVAAGRPDILFGEQVASAAVFGKVAKKSGGAPAGEPEWAWLDDLSGRLEAAHYAVGASDIPAAGVGAPHLRQRTFFGAVRLADARSEHLRGKSGTGNVAQGAAEGEARERQRGGDDDCVGSTAIRLDDPASPRHDGPVGGAEGLARNETWLRLSGAGRDDGGLADAAGSGWPSWLGHAGEAGVKLHHEGGSEASGLADAKRSERGSSSLRGFREADGAQGGGASAEPAGGRDGGGLADTTSGGRGEERPNAGGRHIGDSAEGRAAGHDTGGGNGGLADTYGGNASAERQQRSGQQRQQPQDSGIGGLADTDNAERRADAARGNDSNGAHPRGQEGASDLEGRGGNDWPRADHGGWATADWLFCRDGKWRPVEPGTFPLAHGIPARVGRLRGYGNAIVPQAASAFVTAFMEALTDA